MTYRDFDFGDRQVSLDEGVLVIFAGRELTDAIELNVAEAVNLASALLQWATQNRSATPPPPPDALTVNGQGLL